MKPKTIGIRNVSEGKITVQKWGGGPEFRWSDSSVAPGQTVHPKGYNWAGHSHWGDGWKIDINGRDCIRYTMPKLVAECDTFDVIIDGNGEPFYRPSGCDPNAKWQNDYGKKSPYWTPQEIGIGIGAAAVLVATGGAAAAAYAAGAGYAATAAGIAAAAKTATAVGATTEAARRADPYKNYGKGKEGFADDGRTYKPR